ncbi:MAG: class I SAM-dependent methyltransferase [Candidatus Omnitrophota bacterium]|nr:class I SAM-dependent methyltransferase [Candidatus Omnitrophota bacterium]
MSVQASIKSESNLRSRVKFYKKWIDEIQKYLSSQPQEWGRFQSEFNQEVNGVFRDLMLFEKETIKRGSEEKVYKLKMFFVRWFREDFVRGWYIPHSVKQPYGYAGDFEIIDLIYKNNPNSLGLERLYDNYFQMSAISIAVRNRKEDFKKIISNFVQKSPKKNLKIMDLASGPCRDVYELLCEKHLEPKNVQFDCYDSDPNSSQYAKQILESHPSVAFFNQNAVRIALMRDVAVKIPYKYDVIFSTGLFDYLDYGVSVRLISNLKKLLADGGILAISDVRDKFSNPSIYFMEWVAEWNLIYRPDDEFRNIFLEAGFSRNNLSFDYEQQGVMQYVIAKSDYE